MSIPIFSGDMFPFSTRYLEFFASALFIGGVGYYLNLIAVPVLEYPLLIHK